MSDLLEKAEALHLALDAWLAFDGDAPDEIVQANHDLDDAIYEAKAEALKRGSTLGVAADNPDDRWMDAGPASG